MSDVAISSRKVLQGVKFTFGIRCLKFLVVSVFTLAVLTSFVSCSASYFFGIRQLIAHYHNDFAEDAKQQKSKPRKSSGWMFFSLRFHMRFQSFPQSTVYFFIPDFMLNLSRSIELECILGKNVYILCLCSWEVLARKYLYPSKNRCSVRMLATVRPEVVTAWTIMALHFLSAHFSWQVFALPNFQKLHCRKANSCFMGLITVLLNSVNI